MSCGVSPAPTNRRTGRCIMTERQEYKEWAADRGALRFMFELTYPDSDCLPTVKTRMTWRGQQDDQEICIAPPLAKIDLHHTFCEGVHIRGFLQWLFIARSGDRGIGAIWGDFHYGDCGAQHFEGAMITFSVPASAEIPTGPESPAPHDDDDCDDPCDPCNDPCDDPCDEEPCPPALAGESGSGIVDPVDADHEQCDLFPYVYLRRWPRLSDEDLALNFVRYKKPADISANLYATLLELRSGDEPGVRQRMEQTAVDFAEGDPPWQDQFITARNPLTGPISDFSKLYRELRAVCGINWEKLLAEIRCVLGMNLEELAKYLKSASFAAEHDRVWQNFFALVIILGYRAELLEETIEILVVGHLLNAAVNAEKKPVPEPILERLIKATIILPPSIYPLPPSSASPPVGSPPDRALGWIEPYAIGDLQMVRQKLVRYQPGEIAYIVNVLPGERKEISKRTLQKTTESRRDEIARAQVHENEDRETRENYLSEIAKSIAENTVTTSYTDFNTTYGAPTTATLNGSWDIKTEPTPDQPSKEDISRFARDVLNKTATRMANHTRGVRIFVHQDELEQGETSIFDNTGGASGICGIYRWLNKVYRAWVAHYGNRLMVEFLVPDPAENYLRLEAEREGAGHARQPTNPRELGIFSFLDISRENYALLAARYEVTDIEPPPPMVRTVTAFLQSEEEKSIVIPEGYRAVKAFVAGAFPQGESGQITGLVGQNIFTFSGNTGQLLQMKGEDTTVPVALFGNGVPASPPMIPNNNLATVSVSCQISKTAMDRWRIRTYNAILAGFKAQNAAFFQTVASAAGTGKRQSPEVSRRIERRALKQRCVALLLDRYYQLVGRAYSPLVDPTPFNVGEPRYLQFFDQIFEWLEMTYSFSTDFKTESDVNQLNAEQVTQESDDLFGGFIRADFARVMVPVRNHQELIILFYLSSGMIWCDSGKMTPVHQADVALANELKNLTDCPRPHEHCRDDGWEVVIPTSMCVLQKDRDLSPCVDKQPICENEEAFA